MFSLSDFRDWPVSKKAGFVILTLACALPGLALNGFLWESSPGMPLAFAAAAIGGAVGGALFCRRPLAAGLVGGILAATLGLVAVYVYTLMRRRVWNWELALVLLVGCAPGALAGYSIKRRIEERRIDKEDERAREESR